MPDKRKHRGRAPEDDRLFSRSALLSLRLAASDLAWLLDREYPRASALKLVGDRHALLARQRTAVSRSTCSAVERDDRLARMVPSDALVGTTLHLDGYNVLTTVEAALAGGVLLLCRDGCVRDMASMHGSWRKVEETERAIGILGHVFQTGGWRKWTWLLDRPVANSGRLSQLIRETADTAGWDWEVQLPGDADKVLMTVDGPIASADSVVLDNCGRWHNLAAHALETLDLTTRPLEIFPAAR